jgi:outer membrane immunogenic protein
MRRLSIAVIAAASTIAFAQIASAADLGRRVYKAPPPPPTPIYSWTGWYVGLNAGYAWENTIDNTVTTNACFNNFPAILCPAAAAAIPTRFDTHPKGFIGGAQIGYNYQIAPDWLVGIETDFQGADIKGDDSQSNSVKIGSANPFNSTGTGSQKIDWFGTVRGRLGWLPVNPLLVYATGGLAYGHTRTDVSFASAIGPLTGAAAVSQDDTRAGWTIGGGLEWMFAPNWSLKGEYLYYDLCTVTLNSTVNVFVAGNVLQTSTGIQSDAHYHGNIVRGGVNYHF